MAFHNARSCEVVLVRDHTGKVSFARGAAVDPSQALIRFDTAPVVHRFEVQAMGGRLSFGAVLTVGPPLGGTNRDSRLRRYADFVSRHDPVDISWLVQTTVQAQITAAEPIAMEDVQTPHFKQTILQRVEPRLGHFGLMVYHFDFDAALGLAYFSNLVGYTGQVQQNILFVKELKVSDLNHQLTLPKRVFDHLLGTCGATFEPGVGLTYLGSQDKYRLNFNVTDDWGTIRELTCRIRKTGDYSRPEIISNGWRRFVYDWNLQLGDFIIFYELFGHFTGIKYKIGVVRVARIP